ncbi:MAG: hypothetical protein J6B37_01240 [Clostridia bacterium]|nr:hypothetical protein [Clostridia bacterium]
MKICTTCLFENQDDNVYCEKCGAKMPEEAPAPAYASAPAQPQYQPPVNNQPSHQNAYQQPYQAPYQQPYQAAYQQPMQITEAMLPAEYKPVSVGAYIGYSILFALPIIGFIMLLVTAFSSEKSKSLRNYAKSILVMTLIALIPTILIMILVGSMAGDLLYYYF